jgi:hypothetical protein
VSGWTIVIEGTSEDMNEQFRKSLIKPAQSGGKSSADEVFWDS